jgi:hypothetical protein
MTTMLRFLAARAVRFRPALIVALALVVIAWSARALAVTSVVLSPSTVAPGSSTTGTVGLDAVAANDVTVQLASTNVQIAAVPASVIVNAGKTKTFFPVITVRGAGGCAEISAQVGTTPRKTALLIVRPNVPSSALKLTLPFNDVASGVTTSGSVTIVPAPAGPTVVQLSSSTALATVPASVTAQITPAGDIGNIGYASFPITTAVGGPYCPVITATMSGASTKGLFKVINIGG